MHKRQPDPSGEILSGELPVHIFLQGKFALLYPLFRLKVYRQVEQLNKLEASNEHVAQPTLPFVPS